MPHLTYRDWIARSLARGATADLGAGGGTDAQALAARMAAVIGNRPKWIDALAQALSSRMAPHSLPADLDAWAQAIAGLPAFDEAFADGVVPRVRRVVLRPPRMGLAPLGLEDANWPALATTGELAAWLGVDVRRLQWFTNPALAWRPAAAGRRGPAPHYTTRAIPKPAGGLRLIEAPKFELKMLQRRLLDGLLSRVPVHEACHGFVAGRSPASHAAAHVGRAVVVRLDLKDFFASVRASRVHAAWRTLGFPAGVARTLTALCTTRTPPEVIDRLREDGGIDWWAGKKLASPHLPQGAPTSPALANLCAFALDLRLAGLAHAFGATYTRYADDLVFSGGAALRRRVGALRQWVAAIAADVGFELNRAKTRVMPRHRTQRVGGVVVNVHPNTPRADYDRLKATLHRCVLRGPAAQGGDGVPDLRRHLLGRIEWTRQSNPRRADKLMRLFRAIRWPDAAHAKYGATDLASGPSARHTDLG